MEKWDALGIDLDITFPDAIMVIQFTGVPESLQTF